MLFKSIVNAENQRDVLDYEPNICLISNQIKGKELDKHQYINMMNIKWKLV